MSVRSLFSCGKAAASAVMASLRSGIDLSTRFVRVEREAETEAAGYLLIVATQAALPSAQTMPLSHLRAQPRSDQRSEQMIVFKTQHPTMLLKAFNDAIARGHHKDGITTWIRDGVDYTHAAAQWTREAYFRPHVEPSRLVFNIVKNQAQDVSVLAYGYYHGHLLETFLNHFDEMFAAVSCTPLCDAGDYCKAA